MRTAALHCFFFALLAGATLAHGAWRILPEKLAAWVLLPLWLLYLIWLFVSPLRAAKSRVLPGILLAIVLVGSLTPNTFRQKLVTETKKHTYTISRKIITGQDNAKKPPMRPRAWNRAAARIIYKINKFGHFVLFALLAIALLRAVPAQRRRQIPLDLTLTAGGTEMMQFFVPGRTPLLRDFYLDCAGIALGLSLWLVSAWIANAPPFSTKSGRKQ